VHKTFYASGFIYHLPSQQILLQQQQSTSSTVFPWLLFEKSHGGNEQPEIIFKSIILNFLRIEVKTVYPIYSYFNETTKQEQCLLYGIVKTQQEFPKKNGYSFHWFSFKEVLKIQANQQTKHDIVVGQRVIEATLRQARGEHTLL